MHRGGERPLRLGLREVYALKPTLATRFALARLSRGLKINDVRKLASTPVLPIQWADVAMLERGERTPAPAKLRAIAKALGIRPPRNPHHAPTSDYPFRWYLRGPRTGQPCRIVRMASPGKRASQHARYCGITVEFTDGTRVQTTMLAVKRRKGIGTWTAADVAALAYDVVRRSQRGIAAEVGAAFVDALDQRRKALTKR